MPGAEEEVIQSLIRHYHLQKQNVEKADREVGADRAGELADRGGVSDQAGQADTAARNVCSGRAGHTDNLVGTGQDQVSAPKHIGEEEVDTNVHPKVPECPDNNTGTIPIFLKVGKIEGRSSS